MEYTIYIYLISIRSAFLKYNCRYEVFSNMDKYNEDKYYVILFRLNLLRLSSFHYNLKLLI